MVHILKHPDSKLTFVIEVDTSESGMGAVLSQRPVIKPKIFSVAFFSKKLSAPERYYDGEIDNFFLLNLPLKN